MSVGSRRLAAIMFTDMVGFSALAERDEALALRLLEEHRAILRPLFEQHSGREIKSMADGFLVEFASAVEAVRCAQRIQGDLAARNLATAPPIAIRIGIHVGDIIAHGDDVLGDGVNVAARIEKLADSGGICLSEDAYRQVRGKVEAEFESLGRPPLKNIEASIEVFRLRTTGKPHVPGPRADARRSV
ncbi:MAG: adenylate/guanylate cyclase domain-containing protein, partial [Fimbriimonas ginsengisoli]|nr:adenylate/guanylate cyclase domain-containing protein [Fimbriimonas ginsengisoli]